MKNYNLHDYNSIHDLKKELAADMNNDFADLKITSSTYTDCEILEIIKPADFNDRPDVMVEVSCNAGIKGFCFRGAVEAGLLVIPEDKKALFNEYFEKLDIAYNLFKEEEAEKIRLDGIKAEKEAELRKIRLAKLAEEKAAREAEEKFKNKVSRELEKFQTLKHEHIAINRELKTSFYTSLGWLAKHGRSLTASMPDFLEKAFIGVFGDVKHRVVDSKKVGPAGYTSQWSLSMNLSLDTNKNMPAELLRYLSNSTTKEIKAISKLGFLYTLAEDWGFRFDKTQDVNLIRSSIPAEHLDEFELGYNL